MKKEQFKVEGITCTNCSKTIIKSLEKVFKDDVITKVNITTSTVYVEYDDKIKLNDIIKVVKNAGYPISKDEVNNRRMIKEIIASAILCIPLLIGMFAHFKWSSDAIPAIFDNGYFLLIPASIIQFYIGRHFYIGAFKSAKKKVFGMDFLVTLGSFSAYFYSIAILLFSNEMMKVYYFEVGSVVITVVLIGKLLEHRVKLKTSEALSSLIDLQVKQARVLKDGVELMVDTDTLVSGDIIVVHAHEQVASDGKIVQGKSTIDESSFTGESIPVFKTTGDSVIGGSLNLDERLIVELTSTGEETVLAQIIKSVEEASLVETKFQILADRISQIFVPIVLCISLTSFILTWVFKDSITIALTNAVAVLLISCPCALGLATPTSIMMGNGIAAKRGILYKGGTFFEIANKISVICFDKTGTLTTGSPQLIKHNLSDEHLSYVNAVSKLNIHPISKSIVKYCENLDLINHEVFELKNQSGKGLEAMVDDHHLLIGNKKLMEENQITLDKYLDIYYEYLEETLTVNFIVLDHDLVGIYGVKDDVKTGSKEVIKRLQTMGITPVMITGDNAKVANSIAKTLNITEVYSQTLPNEKSEIVKKYQDQEKVVAFVGDGVNDAVALTIADVGISVSNGSDIAINSSDVTLMKEDLGLIIDGILISKATTRNIKQNLLWAFSYNIVAIPLAATGQLNMVVAAVAMAFSSIVVVLNALRLRKLKLED